MKKRRGSQNPTKLILCRYKHKMSRYDEAVELYERTGRTAQRWQVLLLRHILATDKAGLWVHTKFGYAVPRRNGKNEVVVMREIFGLKNGEHILHTAHRTTTTHAAWERLYDMLQKAGIPVASTYRAYGREHIFLKNGGKIEFRTRTSKGGLGEGFDLLVIDEAQEYQDDQESSLKYTVSDSPNPQTILCVRSCFAAELTFLFYSTVYYNDALSILQLFHVKHFQRPSASGDVSRETLVFRQKSAA